MTIPTKRIVIAAAVAATALTGTARAAEFKYVPVPEGKIEHTVELIDFTASYTVPGQVPRHERVETWIGRDRARLVRTDATTGRVTYQCVADANLTQCRAADGTVINAGPGPGGGAQSRWQTRAGDAEFLRQTIDDGWYAPVGETVVNGRRATIFNSTDTMPTVEPVKTTIVADAENLRLWSETNELTTERYSSKQTRSFPVDELLDEGAVPSFRMLSKAKATKCKRLRKRGRARWSCGKTVTRKARSRRG